LTILFQLKPEFGLGAAKATDDHRVNWAMFGPLHVLTVSEFGHGTICITRLANADVVLCLTINKVSKLRKFHKVRFIWSISVQFMGVLYIPVWAILFAYLKF